MGSTPMEVLTENLQLPKTQNDLISTPVTPTVHTSNTIYNAWIVGGAAKIVMVGGAGPAIVGGVEIVMVALLSFKQSCDV